MRADLQRFKRITGRDHPADGLKQDILAALNGVPGANGKRFLTRAQARCDGFAQVCVVIRLGFSDGSFTLPRILAERVIHSGPAGEIPPLLREERRLELVGPQIAG